jgi:hypothetical protein
MTIWCKRISWYLPNAPNIHRICNICCFSTTTVVAPTHLNVTCEHIACLVWLADTQLLNRQSAARLYVFKVVYGPSYCYNLLVEGQLPKQNDPLCPSAVEEFLTTKKQFAIGNNFLFPHFFRLFTSKPPQVQLAIRREEILLCFSSQFVGWRLQHWQNGNVYKLKTAQKNISLLLTHRPAVGHRPTIQWV